MVAVEVADENLTNTIPVDPALLQCDQRGRPAIDQKTLPGGLYMEAGIEPASCAEGVTAANEGQFQFSLPFTSL